MFYYLSFFDTRSATFLFNVSILSEATHLSKQVCPRKPGHGFKSLSSTIWLHNNFKFRSSLSFLSVFEGHCHLCVFISVISSLLSRMLQNDRLWKSFPYNLGRTVISYNNDVSYSFQILIFLVFRFQSLIWASTSCLKSLGVKNTITTRTSAKNNSNQCAFEKQQSALSTGRTMPPTRVGWWLSQDWSGTMYNRWNQHPGWSAGGPQ